MLCTTDDLERISRRALVRFAALSGLAILLSACAAQSDDLRPSDPLPDLSGPTWMGVETKAWTGVETKAWMGVETKEGKIVEKNADGISIKIGYDAVGADTQSMAAEHCAKYGNQAVWYGHDRNGFMQYRCQ